MEQPHPPEYGKVVDYSTLIKRFPKEKTPFATREELEHILGSPLPVLYKGGLWTTLYPIIGEPGKAIRVPTHKNPEEYGVTVRDTQNGPRLVPVITDWEHHGNPCQTQSARQGGDTYDIVDYEFDKATESSS